MTAESDEWSELPVEATINSHTNQFKDISQQEVKNSTTCMG